MKPYIQWMAYALAGAFLGGLMGWGMGIAIRSLNLDYVPDVSYYFDKGCREGLAAGTLLAFCALAGKQKASSASSGLLWGLAALAAIVSFALLGGSAAYLLTRLHLLQLSKEVAGQIGNPNRLFFCSGLEWGAVMGSLIFPIIAGVCLWRGRGRCQVPGARC
jgi:hypothetical protein